MNVIMPFHKCVNNKKSSKID